METAADSSKPAPPYFAFQTLLNQLDLMKEKGIPARVDRSFLLGMSGAAQTQFIAGLRSLELIDAAGNVSSELTELVQGSKSERQAVLARVLRQHYPEAVELGKTNATTGQLVEVFNEYGVKGDTARKAIAFYLNAAKYAGSEVPISPMFKTPKVARSPGGTRRPRVAGDSGGGGADPGAGPPAATGITIPEFHPTLAGVLSEFPRRKQGWTQERRDKVMAMFTMAVDFTIPIVEEEPEPEEEFEEETADELQQ